MLTTASHSTTASGRTAVPGPHVFVTPVVRELPRPAAEPIAFAQTW